MANADTNLYKLKNALEGDPTSLAEVFAAGTPAQNPSMGGDYQYAELIGPVTVTSGTWVTVMTAPFTLAGGKYRISVNALMGPSSGINFQCETRFLVDGTPFGLPFSQEAKDTDDYWGIDYFTVGDRNPGLRTITVQCQVVPGGTGNQFDIRSIHLEMFKVGELP